MAFGSTLKQDKILFLLKTISGESIITPPPNNLKNQQAYLTLGC